MRLIVFGTEIRPALASALAEEGFQLEAAPTSAPGSGAVGALAAGLRQAESALGGDPPAAAVVAGGGDPALAAALTAVKLGVPIAWIPPPDADVQVHLTGRVADLTVEATEDARDGARAIAGLAASTL